MENGVWRIKTNEEILHLYQGPNSVADIKKSKLRWLGNLEPMSPKRTIKKIYSNILEGNYYLLVDQEKDDMKADLKNCYQRLEEKMQGRKE